MQLQRMSGWVEWSIRECIFYYSNVDSVEKMYIEKSHDFEINHERGLDSNNWIPKWKSIKMYYASKAENVAVCMCASRRNAWKIPGEYLSIYYYF